MAFLVWEGALDKLCVDADFLGGGRAGEEGEHEGEVLHGGE